VTIKKSLGTMIATMMSMKVMMMSMKPMGRLKEMVMTVMKLTMQKIRFGDGRQL